MDTTMRYSIAPHFLLPPALLPKGKFPLVLLLALHLLLSPVYSPKLHCCIVEETKKQAPLVSTFPATRLEGETYASSFSSSLSCLKSPNPPPFLAAEINY